MSSKLDKKRLLAIVLFMLVVLALLSKSSSPHHDKNETARSTAAGASPNAGANVPASQSHSQLLTKPSEPTPVTPPGWKEITSLHDDFSDDSVDEDKWGIYEGEGNAGVGTRERSAVKSGNGHLTITGSGTAGGGLAQLQDRVYGRWEIRARQDLGTGYGPAILLWPQSGKWPDDGEIDIAEIPHGDRTEAVMTTHYGKDNLQKAQTASGDFTQWHTYALDWSKDAIVWYIDGEEQFRVTDPAAIPTKPMHLAIQNDVGSCDSWIGCRNDETPKEVNLDVDWVRVYQKP